VSEAPARLTPARIVYKEILAGDLRKLRGESNDTQSGGGARDLRFPWRAFRPVMHLIFTREETRGAKAFRSALVNYVDDAGDPRTTKLEYWPATPSRPSEDRVSKVHSSPALGGSRMPAADRGRVFVVLSQFTTGEVRCDYAYEDDLRAGKWASAVRTAILGCAASTAEKNLTRTANFVPIQGYWDFTDGTGFCYAE
jgi:hypothetical protein